MNDYKIIIGLVKPFWKSVTVAVLISIIISGSNASLAWLAKPAIDGIFVQKNNSLLLLLPIAVLMVFVLKGTFTYLHEYIMFSASQKMIMNVRNSLFGHILLLPSGYFSKNSSGSLISKVINDTQMLQEILSLSLKTLLIESVTFIALAGVALYRSWKLALMAMVGLPLAFYGVARIGEKLKLVSKRLQERISEITEILSESFTGVKMIKAFCKEEEIIERFKNINNDYYKENIRSIKVSEFASLSMEFVAGFGIAFVMWYGGKLVLENTMTPGDLFSFTAALLLMYTPVRRLVKVNNGIQKARASLQRVFHLMREEKEPDGKFEVQAFKREIKYDGVSFMYPSAKRKALDSVSFVAKKGMVVAVVGKSGAGKTTLVNMLPRLYFPDMGKIYLDNVDIATLTSKSLRNLSGIVSQDVILFNDTALNNIKYGRPGSKMEEVVAATKAAYAHKFITELPQGYNTDIGERGVKLSGGQKQRLSIARAILKNPPILILDEATSSLDTASEMMIQKALENLMGNRTTLVIAHRLSTVKKADLIIVMDKGKIVESGTHEELLLQSGLYQTLYDLQFKG